MFHLILSRQLGHAVRISWLNNLFSKEKLCVGHLLLIWVRKLLLYTYWPKSLNSQKLVLLKYIKITHFFSHWGRLCFMEKRSWYTQENLICSPISYSFSSVQSLSRVWLSWLQLHGLQHSRLPCPSPTPRACSNSCPLSQWCHPTISSSVIPFSCLQSPSIRVFSKKSVLCIRWV